MYPLVREQVPSTSQMFSVKDRRLCWLAVQEARRVQICPSAHMPMMLLSAAHQQAVSPCMGINSIMVLVLHVCILHLQHVATLYWACMLWYSRCLQGVLVQSYGLCYVHIYLKLCGLYPHNLVGGLYPHICVVFPHWTAYQLKNTPLCLCDIYLQGDFSEPYWSRLGYYLRHRATAYCCIMNIIMPKLWVHSTVHEHVVLGMWEVPFQGMGYISPCMQTHHIHLHWNAVLCET